MAQIETGELYEEIVDEENDDLRIDKWIAETFPDFSRNYIQKLIGDGQVSVDGITASKNSVKVKVGQRIVMSIPSGVIPDIVPWDHPLDILYEDGDVIVVNKPKGMVVHPAAGHMDDTLVNALLYHCKDSLSGINGTMRPGIVHRIDRDTTGSLIICKNDHAHQIIAEQLKCHSISREYRAIVCGVIAEDELTVSEYIGRDPRDRKRMAVTDSVHGKRAVTHVRVLDRFDHFTEVACTLETGRTHQIRVHMDHIHHPVLGDPLYGHDLGLKSPMKLEGQCLHAYILGFEHPTTHEYIEFKAPVPEYYEKLLTVLKS